MYSGIDKNAQYLVDLMFAPIYQKICFTAIKLNIFSLLQNPISYQTLANNQGWHSENTSHFLNVLVGMKLIEKNGDTYQNTPTSQKYLIPGTDYYMGDFMQIYFNASDFHEETLSILIRKGPDAAGEEKVSNVSFADMVDIMRSAQKGARSSELMEILSDVPEYKSAKKLLDLGGGTGMLGITAAKGNRQLSSVIFDIPGMKSAILESINQNDMADRVTVITGNYIKDDIGSGYDIIIAFATLNFAKPAMEDIMRKLYSSLNDGGVLITYGDGIDTDGTTPVDMVAGWLSYTLKGMDFRMPSGLIPKTALNVGFRTAHSMTIPTYSGTTELNIIRK